MPNPPSSRISTTLELTAHFRAYIRLLNTRLMTHLGSYVAPRVEMNGRQLSLTAFSTLIPPGSVFTPAMIIADVAKRSVAVRLGIEVPETSVAAAAGLPNAPTSAHIHEHVFYHFNEQWLIDQVWSAFSYGESRVLPSKAMSLPSPLPLPLAQRNVDQSVDQTQAQAQTQEQGPTPTGIKRCNSPPSTADPARTTQPRTTPFPDGRSKQHNKEATRVAIRRVMEARARVAQHNQNEHYQHPHHKQKELSLSIG
jgi:predicted ester cyclase